MIKLIETTCTNPWQNLAVEEYLLDNATSDSRILYLWQNANTIVIGKNQNAWRECRVDAIEQDGVALSRRITGGGAVYHDSGNLNFSFIMGEKHYHLERQLSVIQAALNTFGLSVAFSGRNDILLNGRKFSGNAFAHRKGISLHHGTILIDADMQKMSRYLHVSQDKMRAKGVTSVHSRVINLTEEAPSITAENLKPLLFHAFESEYGPHTEQVLAFTIDNDQTRALYRRNSSWQWRYGATPTFDITFGTRFDWGGLEIGLQLEKAVIVKATVYSDGMDPVFFEQMSLKLTGCRYTKESVMEAVSSLHREERIVTDITAWLSQQNY
ncbi:MAG: lipoate--protein ligase [Christensenellales bacterium]